MLHDRLETVQLLARFKLSVRRHLQIAVDLQLLETDRGYADRMLAAIESAADDEQLLILTLQVRDAVLRPVAAPVPAPAPAPAPVALVAAQVVEAALAPAMPAQTRSYMFGARGW